MVYFAELRKDRFWLSCSFQNEDKEKERKRQQEQQAARTNSPKTDADQEEEENDDDDQEPDNTRQTPENPSSGKRQTTKTFSNFSPLVYYCVHLCGWDLLCARLTG